MMRATLIASNSMALGTGAVTVQPTGSLITNKGVNLSNPITLADGGTIAGFGTFSTPGGLTIQNGSTVVPGAGYLPEETGSSSVPATGTLSFGASTPLTLGQGGILLFSINDASGAADSGSPRSTQPAAWR